MPLPSGRLRRRRPALPAAGALLLVGVAVAACSSMPSWMPFSGSSESQGPPAAACPTAAILRPLGQTAVFAPGAAHQPMGVAFYGVLSDVSAKCERSGDALHAALDIVVVGERGPAAGKTDSVDLQYFVAFTGPDQTVLSKRTLPVHIEIPANARRAGITDHIEQIVALGGRPVGALNIVVGFQQSPDVVDFYKHFRGR